MLDYFGVTEGNWQNAIEKDKHFAQSETPFYVGKAGAALASDPNVFLKTGKSLSSWEAAREYGFTDVDGRRPDWERYLEENFPELLQPQL